MSQRSDQYAFSKAVRTSCTRYVLPRGSKQVRYKYMHRRLVDRAPLVQLLCNSEPFWDPAAAPIKGQADAVLSKAFTYAHEERAAVLQVSSCCAHVVQYMVHFGHTPYPSSLDGLLWSALLSFVPFSRALKTWD